MQSIGQGTISSFASSLQSMESGVSGTVGGTTTEPEGYSFNLTAGDGPISAYQGYSDGTFVAAFGSLDAEPIAGHALILFIDAIVPTILFDGNCLAEVSGKTVWVDSVEYTFDAADWAYDSEEDQTFGQWTSNQPDFTNTVEYFVEIK